MPIDLSLGAPVRPSLASAFPNLARMFNTKVYPTDLANFVWNQSGISAADALRIATDFAPKLQFTVAPTRGGVAEVTWFGFRYRNVRLPEFYVCELGPALTGTEIDLYDIGATGNEFDSDVLLTDGAGNTMAAGGRSTALSDGGTPPTMFRVEPAGARRAGFVLVPHAHWNPNKPAPACDSPVKLAAIGAPCLLWVVTSRHNKFGSRDQTNLPVTVIGAASVPHQDSDGSPGEGAPGGDEH